MILSLVVQALRGLIRTTSRQIHLCSRLKRLRYEVIFIYFNFSVSN